MWPNHVDCCNSTAASQHRLRGARTLPLCNNGLDCLALCSECSGTHGAGSARVLPGGSGNPILQNPTPRAAASNRAQQRSGAPGHLVPRGSRAASATVGNRAFEPAHADWRRPFPRSPLRLPALSSCRDWSCGFGALRTEFRRGRRSWVPCRYNLPFNNRWHSANMPSWLTYQRS